MSAQPAALSPPHLVTNEADRLLSQLAESGRQQRAAVDLLGKQIVPSVRPPKVRYTHQGMADYILENPWVSQNELAEMYGYSAGWISTVITSDAFKSMLEERRAEIIDPELRASLKERFQALTAQSLSVLMEKLNKPADQISDQLALRAAELGAKSLGFGIATPPAPPPVDPAALGNLAERLLQMQGRVRQQAAGEVVDVAAREI